MRDTHGLEEFCTYSSAKHDESTTGVSIRSYTSRKISDFSDFEWARAHSLDLEMGSISWAIERDESTSKGLSTRSFETILECFLKDKMSTRRDSSSIIDKKGKTLFYTFIRKSWRGILPITTESENLIVDTSQFSFFSGVQRKSYHSENEQRYKNEGKFSIHIKPYIGENGREVKWKVKEKVYNNSV
jgi:hypothetical protein